MSPLRFDRTPSIPYAPTLRGGDGLEAASLSDLVFRLGETEYAALIDPDGARETRFGTFTHRPDFPDRRDGNQLARVRCARSQVGELLSDLEQLYAGTGVAYRKVSGTDLETWKHLAGALRELGWSAGPTFMMVHREPSARARNPELTVRAVGPQSADLELLYTQDDVVDRGFLFARSAFPRTGGEYLPTGR